MDSSGFFGLKPVVKTHIIDDSATINGKYCIVQYEAYFS